mmetsp:Transcript_5879/g.17646  ORF Transcript_5879/g.17646 Transcript_5879/m.17646 type:complete len:91 (+) Transcript_5879:99-371(+)|eukprot:CAMPEP_0198723306 /NCGR_PEP_ID=MMETSP1475-20131203/833_1 /TAXON_ID= ORGANISM="Unidentified sp., Strain CCMP1999" /NCGR_SAMPLE_ID=MMETSP1475 /ASSEMBLY_ACC=CAM_ASM_001111 /LENGTH=90 /DNA_ID=CAMNT_0044484387 /DNA_START=90 /DNA_END=362 /DNA_ORIENTATION=-
MTNAKSLAMYRSLLRQSHKFSDYNFRMLAIRRVKEKFRENRNETDKVKLDALYEDAQKNLGMLERQTAIGEMFRWAPVAIDDERRGAGAH